MEANHRFRLAPGAFERSRMIVTRAITLRVLASVAPAFALAALPACSEAINADAAATIEARFASSGSAVEVDQRVIETARPRQHTPIYTPHATDEQIVLTLAFPTGRIETSAVVLHQVSPRVADLSQPFVLEYHVTNLTEATLDEVRVHLHEAHNLTLLDCSVHPRLDEDSVYWSLGRLGPAQTRVVRVSARSTAVGPAQTTATVTYRNVLRSQTQVVEPRLELTKSAPEFGARDDVFELVYTLTNAGTGTARKVKLTDDLPLGLTTIDGLKRVSLPVLALGPGQSEQRRVRVRAGRLGSFGSVAVAVGEPELVSRSGAAQVQILDPVLSLSVSGPELAPNPQFNPPPTGPLGPQLVSGPQTGSVASGSEPGSSAHAVYRLSLHNTGRVAARAARVSVATRGLRVVSTSAPAVVGEDSLTLGCDSIEPGETVEFEIVVVRAAGPAGLHAADLYVTLVADHVAPVSVVLRPLDGARVAAASHP
ncbi:MAG: putative repeat protein (TIGR01451 family) [Phycisphaerales bacterium]|jgi:uncharacterized repeat protein (TIGR01451 family)